MTQQEKKQLNYAPQDQDLLSELIANYTPEIVRERQLLDAAIEAQDEEETVDLAKMAAMLNDLDMDATTSPEPRRKIRFCDVCGQWDCNYHPVEIEI